MTSCLPLLLQLPIIIALYQVLSAGIGSKNLETVLYPFVANPGHINATLFGLVNLAVPNIILAVLAGAAQFFQARTMLTPPAPQEAGAAGKDEDMAAAMNKQMMYMMPILTIIIGFSLPGGLALYWLTMSLLTVAQQHWTLKRSSAEPAPTV
jgi:YidC/Oxa1 family membrane protein insertase